MSLKTFTLIAAVIVGTCAFDAKANAQVIVSGGYSYSPGVVTTSYYLPATGVSYYSPAYYTTPYVSGYYTTPFASYYPHYGYSYYPSYYAGYPYYGSSLFIGVGPRRWWWR